MTHAASAALRVRSDPIQDVREIGIEVERWAARKGKAHRPADISALMAELEMVDPNLGVIVREPGPGSIEFAGKHAGTVATAVANIKALHAYAAQLGIDITSSMHTPFPKEGQNPGVNKPRYLALWEALRRETLACGGTEADWAGLSQMNRFAATHGHFSFRGYEISPKIVDERIVAVINVLNLIGPRIARVISTRAHQRNEGHLGIWSRWANPLRFSAYDRWFVSFDQMRETFESLPRLIKCEDGDKEHGSWSVDLVNKLRWSDASDDGGGWWHFVRARPRLGTFEVRLLPSLPDEVLEMAIEALDDLVCYLVGIADDLVGFQSVEHFLRSTVWKRQIAHRTIGIGGLPIPIVYTETDWRADVFS